MHGRVKSSVQPSSEEVEAKRAQIGKYVAAKDLFLQRRQLRLMDARTAELAAKLIELNPDFYSLWALRKEMLVHNSKAQSAQLTQLSSAQLSQQQARNAHLLAPLYPCRLCCVCRQARSDR